MPQNFKVELSIQYRSVATIYNEHEYTGTLLDFMSKAKQDLLNIAGMSEIRDNLVTLFFCHVFLCNWLSLPLALG
jgi:hypothetical protein